MTCRTHLRGKNNNAIEHAYDVAGVQTGRSQVHGAEPTIETHQGADWHVEVLKDHDIGARPNHDERFLSFGVL